MLILILILTFFSGQILAEVDLAKLCLDQDLGAVLAHPRDCSGYVICNVEPSVHYCELGLHFDGENKICNFPENVNCQLADEEKTEMDKPSQSSLMALDVKTGNIINPLTGFDPQNVVCRHFGAYFLPNPKECRSYYLCAYGHMHHHACGLGTLWDYKTQQCLPNYQAICYYKTEVEEKEIIETLQSCNPSTSTTEKFHPTGSSYTRTTEELTTAIPISTTTTTTNVSYTKTTLHVSPTRPQIHPSKKPNSSNPFYIICPSKRQSYVAHPKDCSKYFMCIMGTPVMTSCPAGLLWDSKNEYCDLAKNVKCFQ